MRYQIGSANLTYSVDEIFNFYSSVSSTDLIEHDNSTFSNNPDKTMELTYESGAVTTISWEDDTETTIELHDWISYAPNGELLEKLNGYGIKKLNFSQILESTNIEEIEEEMFSGDDFLIADVPTTMFGYGGNDEFFDSNGNDLVYGGKGNDLIYARQGSDVIYGGSGIDTFRYFSELYQNLDLDKINDGYQVSIDTFYAENFYYGVDTLFGIERIQFHDGTLALDVDAGESAGQAYRLYQAAFAREPDIPGVKYHMNDMEANDLSLENIANNFMASPEFSNKYGASPSDDEFINLLYQNVLGRSADFDGLAYYQNHFNAGTMSRAAALIGFAESPENITLVASKIEDGIWLFDS